MLSRMRKPKGATYPLTGSGAGASTPTDDGAPAAEAGPTGGVGLTDAAASPAEATAPMHADEVATIAGAHFVHDTYTAFLAPLLPILQERLQTSYAMTGGLAVFMQLPNILNPFIGYLADRVSLRYFVIFAPAVTATLICLLGLTPSYLSLALLLVGVGISVSAFHAPAPAMVAHVSGNRIGTGMSIFMASGELGRAVGPLLAVAAVGWFGLEGLWRLAFVGWAVSAVLFVRLRNVSARSSKGGGFLPWSVSRRLFPALALLLGTQTLLVVAAGTYLPLYMSNVAGASLWLAGASLTIVEAAGVLGALMAGTLSDRWGRGGVTLVVTILAPAAMLVFVLGPAALAIPMLVLIGVAAIGSTPVFLAIIQDAFPDNRALANGTFLAVSFIIRAAGIYLIGSFADALGLQRAFLISAVVGFLGIPVVPFVFGRRARA